MISRAPLVHHVHEPFNISSPPCRCGVNFKYWFYYLSSTGLHHFEEHLKHTIYPAYSWVGWLNVFMDVRQSKRIRPLSNYLQSYLSHRVVVKDPIAVFSAETLAKRFDMDVIVLIRHPAAIVNSYKALNWSHPFSHFLSQTELMEEHLFPFRNEIEDFAKEDYEIVDQIALLWKLIHYMILKFQKTNSHWVFVRYEDLVLDPSEGFRKIFEQVKLPFSERTQAAIRAHSLRNPEQNTTVPYAIKRNPHQVASKWKKSLTANEVYRVQKRVEPISSAFYSEQDWNE